MTEHRESSLKIRHEVTEALLEYPITTDRYLVYTYFCYHVVRSQYVYDDPYWVLFYVILFGSIALLTFPFFLLRKNNLEDLPNFGRSRDLNASFSVSVPNLFAKKVREGFDPAKVKIISWPDARFMERSSILYRLIFVPNGAFSKDDIERESNLAQLHHDIGHTIEYDYIYEKGAAFVIIDTVVF